MSAPLIIALNIGVAAFLTLLLTTLMLLPKRMRAHHHPHLPIHDQPRPAPIERRDNPARQPRPDGRRRVVTDP